MSKETAGLGGLIGLILGIIIVSFPSGLKILTDSSIYSGDIKTIIVSSLVIIVLTVIGTVVGAAIEEILNAF